MRKKAIEALARDHPIKESHRAEVANLAIVRLDKLKRVATEIPKYRPVRIRYRGEWLILPSGKTIWRRLSDAKSALRNALEDTCEYDRVTGGYRLRVSKDPVGSYWDREVCNAYHFQAILDAVEFVEVDPVERP